MFRKNQEIELVYQFIVLMPTFKLVYRLIVTSV